MSQDLLSTIEEVEALTKQAFTAVPPSQANMPPQAMPPQAMPPQGAPMDPAAAAQMAAAQGGAPMDPAAAAQMAGAAPAPAAPELGPDATAMFMAMQNRLDNMDARLNTLEELRKQREQLVGGAVRKD